MLLTPGLKCRLMMNAEYEILYQADPPPAEGDEGLKRVMAAGDWIGDRIRNWGTMRQGGAFSQIKDVCWLFSAVQLNAGDPVRLRVFTEFGHYASESANPGNLPTADLIKALQALAPTCAELKVTIKPINERHPDYIVLTLECEWPTHQDVLWAEMQRVSDAICRDQLLVAAQQFIG